MLRPCGPGASPQGSPPLGPARPPLDREPGEPGEPSIRTDSQQMILQHLDRLAADAHPGQFGETRLHCLRTVYVGCE